MKRLFDFITAFFAILLLAPFIFIISIMVMIYHGRPILFGQKRPGLNGKIFTMYKFRSMTNERDHQGDLLPDSERLTKFGSFLRASSLDELPGLFSVLKGDMSLVGPRPLLPEYLPLYNDVQARRHDVKPGITGWAQVNGRNAISWEEKFKLDTWYVENRSFLLDMKILFLTVKKVFIREGISSSEHATMPKFTGSNNEN